MNKTIYETYRFRYISHNFNLSIRWIPIRKLYLTELNNRSALSPPDEPKNFNYTPIEGKKIKRKKNETRTGSRAELETPPFQDIFFHFAWHARNASSPFPPHETFMPVVTARDQGYTENQKFACVIG